jgi:hypothetical protein
MPENHDPESVTVCTWRFLSRVFGYDLIPVQPARRLVTQINGIMTATLFIQREFFMERV